MRWMVDSRVDRMCSKVDILVGDKAIKVVVNKFQDLEFS